MDIKRRGPKAFGNLVDSLTEIGDITHTNLALKLEEKEMPVENNNYEKDVNAETDTELQRSNMNTKGAWPYKLSEEQHPQHIRQISQEVPNSNINLSTEPLIVRVKPSTRFYDKPSENKIPVYATHSKQRGLFLCINNIEFINDVQDKRLGAEVDEDNLKTLFRQIGFTVHAYRNQSLHDTKQTIRKLTENDARLRNIDCCIVAIMSHGEEGDTKESSHIITSDNKSLEV